RPATPTRSATNSAPRWSKRWSPWRGPSDTNAPNGTPSAPSSCSASRQRGSNTADSLLSTPYRRSARPSSACSSRPPSSPATTWLMRQAGRYLPEYRAVRARISFLELCKTPDLAAEVTLQPVDILGVDAAILFSDILVVCEAMGMKLILEDEGPQFPTPLRTQADVDRLHIADPEEKLGFVTEAIRLVRRQLAGTVPLIG